MFKNCCFTVLLLLLSMSSHAVEPVFDQQMMVYLDMRFEVGKKQHHQLGLRFDNTFVAPGESVTVAQLAGRPAVLNLSVNEYGTKRFEFTGIDYTAQIYPQQATDETDAETADSGATESPPSMEPKKKIEVPLGFIIGAAVGLGALAGVD